MGKPDEIASLSRICVRIGPDTSPAEGSRSTGGQETIGVGERESKRTTEQQSPNDTGGRRRSSTWAGAYAVGLPPDPRLSPVS